MMSDTTGWGIIWWLAPTIGSISRAIGRTTDSGVNWQDVTLQIDGFQNAASVRPFFLDGNNAWVAITALDDATVVWRTSDGGATWTPGEPLVHFQMYSSPKLTFSDPQHGWLMFGGEIAMGAEGVALLRSSDGGVQWQEITRTSVGEFPPTPGHIYAGCYKSDLGFRDALTGWVTGSCGESGYLLEVTRNGGSRWENQDLAPPVNDSSLFQDASCIPTLPIFSSPEEGLLTVNCSALDLRKWVLLIYHTHDGGLTWGAPDTVVNEGTPATSLVYQFSTVDEGWYFRGTLGATTSNSISLTVTHDGGHTWTEVEVSQEVTNVKLCDLINPVVGWCTAYDQDGQVYLLKTADGGMTWTRIDAILLAPPGN